MPPHSPQRAPGGATPTSSADRPLLHRRYRAILTRGLQPPLNEKYGSGHKTRLSANFGFDSGDLIERFAGFGGWRFSVCRSDPAYGLRSDSSGFEITSFRRFQKLEAASQERSS